MGPVPSLGMCQWSPCNHRASVRTEVWEARRQRLGLGPCLAEGDPEAHPPLAAYLQAELDLLLRRLPSEAWKDRASFVLFRSTRTTWRAGRTRRDSQPSRLRPNAVLDAQAH